MNALTCDKCGGDAGVIWVAPDDLWLRFNGGPDGVACALCFFRWAYSQDIPIRFRAEVVKRAAGA